MQVLIADDDPVSRYLLQNILESAGHQVSAAADGGEAWRLFEAGDFPLVITDWMMPELDGIDLVRRIRSSQRPHYVYTILLTARSHKEDVVAGMGAGADDFVTKPFDWDELRVRCRQGERILALEKSLRETQAALCQSEKLASVGQLAAGVAHEINNPLAYVLNNLAVLRQDVPALLGVLDRYRSGRDALARAEPDLAAALARLEEEEDLPYLRENLERLVHKSLEGLQRVRQIVRNLRDFARLDEAEFKEVDLNAGLEATLEMIGHEVKKKELTLQREYGELPPVACHPGKINQVFLNLLVNAVQACAPGGRITVRSRGAAEEVAVEVEDTGCGIAAEHLPRLFEPFFTTKPLGEGTGLGLSLSYGIVRDHGGRIEVESVAGRGSLFRVRLPLVPGVGSQESGVRGQESATGRLPGVNTPGY
jgi:signal transduction histidine kinase